MSATTFNPRSSRSFHLDGYEVTVDEIDMKLSEFENKGPRYQDGPTIMILPINIRINEHINVPGDIYIMGKEFGFTLYNVHDYHMKYYDLKRVFLNVSTSRKGSTRN